MHKRDQTLEAWVMGLGLAAFLIFINFALYLTA